jgi:hypothetical protein
VNQVAVATGTDCSPPITAHSRDQVVRLVPLTADAVELDALIETVKLQFPHGLERPHDPGWRLGQDRA